MKNQSQLPAILSLIVSETIQSAEINLGETHQLSRCDGIGATEACLNIKTGHFPRDKAWRFARSILGPAFPTLVPAELHAKSGPFLPKPVSPESSYLGQRCDVPRNTSHNLDLVDHSELKSDESTRLWPSDAADAAGWHRFPRTAKVSAARKGIRKKTVPQRQ
jgi:hypothetical protein